MAIMLINQISILITLPWLISNLTPVTFGLIATALIIMQAGWVIIEWAQTNYVTEVWHFQSKQLQKNKLISQLILSRLLMAGGYIVTVAAIISQDIISLPWEFFFTLILATVAGGLLPLWFFHVIKKPGELVGVTLISRTFFVLLTLCYVRTDNDASTYLALQSLSFLAITLFAFWRMVVAHHFRWQVTKLSEALAQIRISNPFVINTLTNDHIHIFWSLALTMLASPIAIGIYNLAEQAYRAGSAITSALAQVMRVNSKKTTLRQAIGLIFPFMFGTLLISLVGQWVISEYLAYLLPISFNEATIIFHAMLVIWLVQTWVKLVNYPITGKAIGLVKLHRLAPWILVIHLGFIIFWFAKSGTLDSFVIYFLAASIIQLIILINAVIIKYYID
jgi:hypothetical protein